ncbi:MAG: hypothetical protein WDW38_005338 [Sanguina aurantia]
MKTESASHRVAVHAYPANRVCTNPHHPPLPEHAAAHSPTHHQGPEVVECGKFQDALAKLQADPFFASILRQPRVQQAVRDLQRDPGTMRRHANDKAVMSVLSQLLEAGMSEEDRQAYADVDQTPAGFAASVYSSGELCDLLQRPNVRAALAALQANPEQGLDKFEGDADVKRALDLMEQLVQ